MKVITFTELESNIERYIIADQTKKFEVLIHLDTNGNPIQVNCFSDNKDVTEKELRSRLLDAIDEYEAKIEALVAKIENEG